MEDRDDIIEYSKYNHHSEEEGKVKRKRIWQVTLYLSIITAVEVALGLYVKQGSSLWGTIKVLFILLTVVKAAYIVMSFMHMGEEQKIFRKTILWVYAVLILYFIVLILIEGAALYPRMYNFPW